MLRPALLAVLTLTVALAAAGEARPPKPGAQATSVHIRKGLSFARERCAACHGVTANSTSPNPESPPFEEIANRPGLTSLTLRQFLRDSHNYPEAMDFAVERERIRDLADYIVTLKKPGYKPVM